MGEFEFVYYIGFFNQQRVGNYFFLRFIYFVNGQIYFNFNIFISNYFTLQTLLREVLTVEIINEKCTIEVKIL